jgi:hypothetical protein
MALGNLLLCLQEPATTQNHEPDEVSVLELYFNEIHFYISLFSIPVLYILLCI